MPMLLLLALLCGPFFYRAHHLSQIPDPGDPFDVEAFIKASHVADADNALGDFLKALSLMSSDFNSSGWKKLCEELLDRGDLSAESQDALKSLKINESAILAWKNGTAKLDFCEISLSKSCINSPIPATGDTCGFCRAALVHALLDWQKGNYEKSADWYLANFHTSRLVQRNGGIVARFASIRIYTRTTTMLVRQLQDKLIPEAVIEKMLEELKQINESTVPFSESLFYEYITLLNSKEILVPPVPSQRFYAPPPSPSSPLISSWKYYCQGEPELYIKLIRQWFGNILPEIDRPRYQRSRYTGKNSWLVLFDLPPGAPAKSKQMTPSQIEDAWSLSVNANHYGVGLRNDTIDPDDRYRMTQRLLEATLKLEIYRRQYGKYPSSLEDVHSEGEVPVDLFDPQGGPIKYAKDADDASRIWSNGVDEIDNGGTTFTNQQDDKDCGYYLGKEPK